MFRPINNICLLTPWHGLRVGEDEGVEGEDLEHLERGDERAAALLHDVAHALDG